MKKWYKILAICFVTMCMVLLGGCTKQAQLNSEMTVKEDGSGTRTIQIAMDKNLVKRGFKGSERTLERLMDQYCPRELEWEVDERQSLYDLTLTLSFDTLDEYVEKAEALVGTKKIELKDTGQGLQVGFSLEENVTAEDFLDWLKDALVKERYIKRSEKEDLFRLEKTYFSYAGERRSVSNGKIRYQYQKEYDTEQIVMLTQPDTGEQWSRVIYLYFPSELMERREAQVREFVKDRISKDTQVKWLSKTCVCLTFPQADRYKLSQDMQSFFGQASCKIEETMEQNSTFSFGYQYQEYIDMEAAVKLFGGADKKVTAGLIEDYFEDILEGLPENSGEIYSLLHQIKLSLEGMASNSESAEDTRRFTEEIMRFREWYVHESEVRLSEDNGNEIYCSLRDAITASRMEKFGGEKYSYDFEEALNYQLDSYTMSFADIIAAGEEDDNSGTIVFSPDEEEY